MPVKLEQCAILKARLLDKNGKPVRRARTRIVAEEGNYGLMLDGESTDEEGRLALTLIPGGTYTVNCQSAQVDFQTIIANVAVEPGETIDLGEFDVTSEKRPEPKRTAAVHSLGATGSASAPSNSRNGLAAMGGAAADGTGKASGTRSASGTLSDANDDLIAVRGRVVDPQGKPVVSAGVFATYWHYPTEKNPAPVATTKSDENGRFELTYSKSEFDKTVRSDGEWQFTTIVAAANDFGPAWVTYYDVQARGELTLKLVPDEPIEGRIVSLEGEPIAGAIVEARNHDRRRR